MPIMSHRRPFATLGRSGLTVLFAAASVVAADNPKAEVKPVAVNVGDKAPIFDGRTDAGKKWKSSETVGKKYLVVYFYPADFTTGCTRQAQVWRDNLNAVTANGVEVVGVSGDSVTNHALFKKAWKLNFNLLADPEGLIAKKFGVPIRPGGKVRPRGPDRKPITDKNGKPLVLEREATFARWTFIVGKDGKVLYKNTRVNPALDSQQVLEFIKKMKKPESKAAKPSK
jgi:thioredoxin-dependent peroxiredoxin